MLNSVSLVIWNTLPTGRVNQADVTMMSCSTAEDNVMDSLNRSDELSEEVKEQLRRGRQSLYVDGRVTETYRRIELYDALQILTQNTSHGTTTRSYMDILGNNPIYTTCMESNSVKI